MENQAPQQQHQYNYTEPGKEAVILPFYARLAFVLIACTFILFLMKVGSSIMIPLSSRC